MPDNNPTQNLANHTMLDPPFHFVFAPIAAVLIIYSVYNLIVAFSLAAVMTLLMALAIGLAGFKARIYALKVQDRVIRLEERLRLMQLLPAAQHARVLLLTEDQLVGLRFACDAEAPALVEKAVTNNWKRKEIKQAIQSWRPDYFRV